jgi:hypothetical protein
MRQRILRLFSLVARWLISSVVKTAITAVVCAFSLMITLRYLGVPVPSPHEVIEKFEALGTLAKILS